ncbi:MAG: nicotinate (nicotinamide) nucleotide adenylyltransferase [Myxococcaceae bacterium]
MDVALIGGSFNPPHVGHLLAAHFVRATEPVDAVWLVPANQHPYGKHLVPFEHRRRMCELLCADTPGWLGVSEVEQQLGGGGRTVDTLRQLSASYPGHRWTLVLGSDLFADFPNWKEPDTIRSLARLLVLNRAGHPCEAAVGPAMAHVSSSEVREALAEGRDVSHLVPRPVLAYAQAMGLYR